MALENRLSQLDGLRFFAVLAVFLYHFFHLPLLWVGVDTFFVLSGFLITAILLKNKGSKNYYSRFYVRRALRIFPPYFLVLSISLIFLLPELRKYLLWYITFTSNFLEPLYGKAEDPLSPLWSLAIEQQFYLIWPFVVNNISRKGLYKICSITLIVTPFIRIITGQLSGSFLAVYSLTFCRMDLLCGGALLALLNSEENNVLKKNNFLLAILSGLCAFVFFILVLTVDSFKTSQNSMLFNSIGFGLIAFASIFLIAFILHIKSGFIYKLLTNKPIVYLGSISYMLYLCHYPIIYLFCDLSINTFFRFVITASTCVGFASLSWFYFERPLLRFKDKVTPVQV
jgi:peptidoglycan/LPS O-acetylase OafA/YrhL